LHTLVQKVRTNLSFIKTAEKSFVQTSQTSSTVRHA
jgi:hypothetical protein